LPDPDAAGLRAAVERLLANADFVRSAGRVAEEIAALPPVDSAVDAMAGMASR
jgi:hypothetical protein